MPDTDETPSKEQVLAMAEAFDRGENVDAAPSPAPANEPAPEKASDQEIDPPETDTPEVPPAPQAVSKETKPNTPAKPEAKPDPNKSKYAQNEERKTNTWQAINERKAAQDARDAELSRREQAIAAKASRAAANEPVRDEHGFTAFDYAKVAKQYRDQGDAKTAAAAEQLAMNMSQREQSVKSQRAQHEFVQSWTESYEKQVAKYPELADKASPLAKEVTRVLTDFPLLCQDPRGIEYATVAARLGLQGQEFDGTKAEFTKLKAEHDKLLKKLSIAGGPPTGAPADEKSFDDMNLAEQRTYLERAVAQRDRDDGFGG